MFEDVWKQGDEIIFEEQLKQLADYIVDNNLYDKYSCTLFDDYIGGKYSDDDLNNTSCGAGKMLAVDPDGNLYPCMRYYDYSLNKRKGYIIGNIKDGIDFEKVRPFGTLMYRYQSDEECLKCDVATGCSFCQGFNYDEAETPTNFVRAKYICKMHKARVRANDYYFSLLLNKKSIRREGKINREKQMFFLLGDDVPSMCSYSTKNRKVGLMSEENILHGLEYCRNNFIMPVFVHGGKSDNYQPSSIYDPYTIIHIYSIERFSQARLEKDYILVCDNGNYKCEIEKQDNIILNIESIQLYGLAEKVKYLFDNTDRININVQNLTSEFDYELYGKELEKISEIIEEYVDKKGVLKEVNVITDVMYMSNHGKCLAGSEWLTYAPDGKIYVCPATYFEKDNCENVVSGNFETGLRIANQHLYTQEYDPLCKNCTAYQCENCSWLNWKFTNEVGVSPSFQCKKAMIENEVSYKLQRRLNGKINWSNEIVNDGFGDPYWKMDGAGTNLGYYDVI